MIVTADQASVASDFWIRAIPQTTCSDSDNPTNIKGIVHYGSSTGTPTTTGYAYTVECVDEPYASLVPFVSKTAGSSAYSESETVTVAQNSENYFRWYLNGTSLLIQWEDPVS